MTRLWAGWWTTLGSVPGGNVALHCHFGTGSRAYPAHCPVGTTADADHSSAAVPRLGKMSCKKAGVCNRPCWHSLPFIHCVLSSVVGKFQNLYVLWVVQMLASKIQETCVHTQAHKTSLGPFEPMSLQTDGPYEHITNWVSDMYNIHSLSWGGCRSVCSFRNEWGHIRICASSCPCDTITLAADVRTVV